MYVCVSPKEPALNLRVPLGRSGVRDGGWYHLLCRDLDCCFILVKGSSHWLSADKEIDISQAAMYVAVTNEMQNTDPQVKS